MKQLKKPQIKEFAYYKSCFTDTLRNQKWKQVPSNTLAKGDIIRLLKGDVAPTLIERIVFNQSCDSNWVQDVSQWGETFYNRGSKVGLSAGDCESHVFRKDDDLNEVTARKKREYLYFEVLNTPYIDDLNQFITTDTTASIKDKKNKELLYFKNLQRIEFVSFLCQTVVWCLAISFTLLFGQTLYSYE
jgi:hypothetical protein